MEMQEVVWQRAGSVAQGSGQLPQEDVHKRGNMATANKTPLHIPAKDVNPCLLVVGKEQGRHPV